MCVCGVVVVVVVLQVIYANLVYVLFFQCVCLLFSHFSVRQSWVYLCLLDSIYSAMWLVYIYVVYDMGICGVVCVGTASCENERKFLKQTVFFKIL
jgi:hypothetical protein